MAQLVMFLKVALELALFALLIILKVRVPFVEMLLVFVILPKLVVVQVILVLLINSNLLQLFADLLFWIQMAPLVTLLNIALAPL